MVKKYTRTKPHKRKMSYKRHKKIGSILFNDLKLNSLFGGKSKVPRHVSAGDVRRQLANKGK